MGGGVSAEHFTTALTGHGAKTTMKVPGPAWLPTRHHSAPVSAAITATLIDGSGIRACHSPFMDT
jgi:hypothetical protein